MADLLCRRAAEYAGLTPDQASEMTPYDLQLVIAAGVRRMEREKERTAWQTSLLLSSLTKSHVSMDDLLGPAWTHQRMLRERGLLKD
jgi:hypothetical protein